MRNRFVIGADGIASYVTIDDDMVDDIAQFYYGRHRGTTEMVLGANPGLAAMPLKLPAGVVIRLPAHTPTTEARPFRRLWE